VALFLVLLCSSLRAVFVLVGVASAHRGSVLAASPPPTAARPTPPSRLVYRRRRGPSPAARRGLFFDAAIAASSPTPPVAVSSTSPPVVVLLSRESVYLHQAPQTAVFFICEQDFHFLLLVLVFAIVGHIPACRILLLSPSLCGLMAPIIENGPFALRQCLVDMVLSHILLTLNQLLKLMVLMLVQSLLGLMMMAGSRLQ